MLWTLRSPVSNSVVHNSTWLHNLTIFSCFLSSFSPPHPPTFTSQTKYLCLNSSLRVYLWGTLTKTWVSPLVLLKHHSTDAFLSPWDCSSHFQPYQRSISLGPLQKSTWTKDSSAENSCWLEMRRVCRKIYRHSLRPLPVTPQQAQTQSCPSMMNFSIKAWSYTARIYHQVGVAFLHFSDSWCFPFAGR